MKQPSPAVVSAACAAVALLSLWSTVDFYRATEDLAGSNADVYQIGAQAERFRELAAALPASGIIGYVSDRGTRETLGTVMYDGAQYALAPRLLTERLRQANTPWVVGNFSKPMDVAGFASKRGLTVVRDFGSGVVLLRKEPAQ
ncbi:MAG TPA: hypothetical protein VMH80_20780 [Bryobacteraceae bacterium]|nr:hypothetical protein [Bryobacteraceae bacterium]